MNKYIIFGILLAYAEIEIETWIGNKLRKKEAKKANYNCEKCKAWDCEKKWCKEKK